MKRISIRLVFISLLVSFSLLFSSCSLINITNASSPTTTYKSSEEQVETFNDISYYVPSYWIYESVQEDVVYYYPENAMVMIQKSDVSSDLKLDYETAGQFVSGMYSGTKSGISNVEVVSISSFDMNISIDAYKIDWTAKYDYTDLRNVTICFIYNSHLYSMSFCNYDNELTPEFDDFERIVKYVEVT